MKALIAGALTHETLANTLPFYCCWLVDKDNESKPCAASVVLGSAVYTTYDIHGLVGSPPPRIWIN